MKQPLKHRKRVGFLSGREGFAGQQKPAGVVGHRQRIAVVVIPQQELAFVIGAPQFVGTLPVRQRGALSPTPRPTAALHQGVAIQHRMDRALRGEGNTGEPARQALANFPRSPAGMLTLHIEDVVLDVKWELVGRSDTDVGFDR